LAALANSASLSAHDPPRRTADAFTSVNAAVFLAMLLGVLGTTGSAAVAAVPGPAYRRTLGAKARAYGLIGIAAVAVLGGIAAAIALPIIHARSLASPSSHVVSEYFRREAIAAARLALLGVAFGIVTSRRRLALAILAALLAIDGIAEAHLSSLRDYGPVGALNAFSDPSHHHRLSVGAGAAIAMAWALVALVTATYMSEGRRLRAPKT
jgi:hypothetical protein